MRTTPIIAVLAASVALAACTRSNDALRVNTQAPPQPLPSSPSGTVETAELQPTQNDPLAVENQPGVAEAPLAPGVESPIGTDPNQVASLDPGAEAKPISHETMTGAWTVGTDNPECRVFLSFTQWSGGYRAGTRRCNAPELASVSAWDIKNNRVVLVDSNGTQIASLASAGSERYAGTTSGGNSISFTR
ncbi:MAG: AprI/Inh family metalloprotease inhibitor [Rhizobiaceae bacterium]|nr:AprI/Inh family metalloprotease inhibitor [Rhizobiaceae bacterium]